MRTVGYSVHHSLTPEAATIVKQALSLARRRGHAQVTPLHVASAMLSSSTSLLRITCLQSHSHPLQSKALELCFNVALNRLPTSASTPSLGPHTSHHPTMSNSLVAAFKRAQAHQRRGSIENQQQPILAPKVEIEQLIISILDDPSVSRVMREAGFSSSQVKTNAEQSVSLDICFQKPPLSSQSKDSTKALILSVLDTMMNKKRKNTVVVRECLASAEGVIRGVIDKLERGDIPDDLRFVKFVSLPLLSLRNLTREEVEEKLGELRCLVKSYVGGGVVLYLGDLKWASEFWSNYGEQRNNYYTPLEHMIMELNRLLDEVKESGKLWLMAIANFQTYMRCKRGHPSLETLWELHPLTIPVGNLGLSLNLESDLQDQYRDKGSGDVSNWLNKTGVENHLTCCAECMASFTSSSLPSWLHQYKEENRRQTINDQECEKVRSLCKRWNSICSSVHKQPHFLEKSLHFSSSSPILSASMSSHNQHSPKLHQTIQNWQVVLEPNQSPKEHQFFISKNECECFEPKRPDLLSNPNSSPNSASSSEASQDFKFLHRFKELNSENMKILCNALEKRVPWQGSIIPEIVSTILQCRSRMVRRKEKLKQIEDREETWLFFLGDDCEGKEKTGREIAKVVFGSQSSFIAIGLSSFSSTRADSTEENFSRKRARDENGRSYLERFAKAVQDNPSRVFYMEDVEQIDYHSQMGIKKAIESGRITLADGEFVLLKDAIVIFSCESFSSMSRACSPPIRQEDSEDDKKDNKDNGDGLEEREPCASLDLNIAIEDENGDEHSVSAIGILDLVDRQVSFNIHIL